VQWFVFVWCSDCAGLEAAGSKVAEHGAVSFGEGRVMRSYFMPAAGCAWAFLTPCTGFLVALQQFLLGTLQPRGLHAVLSAGRAAGWGHELGDVADARFSRAGEHAVRSKPW